MMKVNTSDIGNTGWCSSLVATNRKNYSTEALNLLCNLASTSPRHIAYIVTHNRTVNTTGLFLLDTAKKVDEQFQTPHRSSHHTTPSEIAMLQKM